MAAADFASLDLTCTFDMNLQNRRTSGTRSWLRPLKALITCAFVFAASLCVAADKYDWLSIGEELGKTFDVPVESAFEESRGRVHVLLTITSDKLAKGDLKDRQTLALKLNEFFWKNYDDTGRVAQVKVVFQDRAEKPTSDAYTYSPPKK